MDFKQIGLFLAYGLIAASVLSVVFQKDKTHIIHKISLSLILLLSIAHILFAPDQYLLPPPVGRPGHAVLLVVIYSFIAQSICPQWHLHRLIGRLFGWEPQPEKTPPPPPAPPPAPTDTQATEARIEELLQQNRNRK